MKVRWTSFVPFVSYGFLRELPSIELGSNARVSLSLPFGLHGCEMEGGIFPLLFFSFHKSTLNPKCRGWSESERRKSTLRIPTTFTRITNFFGMRKQLLQSEPTCLLFGETLNQDLIIWACGGGSDFWVPFPSLALTGFYRVMYMRWGNSFKLNAWWDGRVLPFFWEQSRNS